MDKGIDFLIKKFLTSDFFTNKEIFHIKNVDEVLTGMRKLGLIDSTLEQPDLIKYTCTPFGYEVLRSGSWTNYQFRKYTLPRWISGLQILFTILAICLSALAYWTAREDVRLHEEEVNIQRQVLEKEETHKQDIQELRQQMRTLQELHRDSLQKRKK